MWSGLGYYSRARNLLRAAALIAERGSFPADYESLRALPGVGGYTAAAVGSICFDLPHVVVDGNVLRVVARLTNDASDIATTSTKVRFESIAQGWLDRKRPALFNQALMELGATVCLPRNPLCAACPVADDCGASKAGTQLQLPVKLRPRGAVRIESTLLLIERRGQILMWRRPADAGRMAGFWELPSAGQLTVSEQGPAIGTFRHSITHHAYHVQVVVGSVEGTPAGFRWLSVKRLGDYPLSTMSRKALRFR